LIRGGENVRVVECFGLMKVFMLQWEIAEQKVRDDEIVRDRPPPANLSGRKFQPELELSDIMVLYY
jgi:hypothetical protein